MRYSRKELVRMTGITHRQFRRWRERGLLPPPEGGGRNSYYTDTHLDLLNHIVSEIIDGRTTLADLEERFMYDRHPELLDDGDVF